MYLILIEAKISWRCHQLLLPLVSALIFLKFLFLFLIIETISTAAQDVTADNK